MKLFPFHKLKDYYRTSRTMIREHGRRVFIATVLEFFARKIIDLAYRIRIRRPQTPISELAQFTPNVQQVLDNKFSQIRPLHFFFVADQPKRINLITDSINSGSLFGGVSTSIVFCALLSKRWNCQIRVITRTEKADKKNFFDTLVFNKIVYDQDVEFVFADIKNPNSEVMVGSEEIFLTTSWWTTRSILGSINEKQILYILQEDERAFYPYGDNHLKCAETLRNEGIQIVINSKLLFDYLVADGFSNIQKSGIYFEPTRPSNIFYYDEHVERTKKNFFFYARPNNLRNIFYFGLEVIDKAVEKGILNPNEWEFYFIGKDIPKIKINNIFTPTILENLLIDEYANIIRKIDLGLCLMYTPHPSFPPLDLACSGGVVLTNKFANKQSLDFYSPNILSYDLDMNQMMLGIQQGIGIVTDKKQRMSNYSQNNITRDWSLSFEKTLHRLDTWYRNAHL